MRVLNFSVMRVFFSLEVKYFAVVLISLKTKYFPHLTEVILLHLKSFSSFPYLTECETFFVVLISLKKKYFPHLTEVILLNLKSFSFFPYLTECDIFFLFTLKVSYWIWNIFHYVSIWSSNIFFLTGGKIFCSTHWGYGLVIVTYWRIDESCHARIRHVTLTSESWLSHATHEWVMSFMNWYRVMRRVTHEWVMSRTNSWCHTHEWVIWHDWVMPLRNGSCHLWIAVSSWDVSHMNESCHTWMSHVTHTSELFDMNESCHL